MRQCALFILAMMMLGSMEMSAQKADSPKMQAQKDYMFRRQMVGGLRLQSTGLGFYLQYGLIKNIYRTHLFMLEYEWHIDYRDKKNKAYPVYTETGRDYYFGVQNRFHEIRFSYGFERAIADKAVRNGVRLSWVGFLGGVMGLVKPYYLNIDYLNPDPYTQGTHPYNIVAQKYSEATKSVFLDRNVIDEAAPISKGLGEMKPVFGGHVRTGLNFDWGSRDAFVKSIEAGASLDIFYKKIPIYVNDQSNHFLFLGLYVSFHMGKRW
ncbi:MAG: hypothetical protein JST90_11640 [Bacteroidetes bacterium]|nr:hypothetical protein [Bacteroidota bacterium]